MYKSGMILDLGHSVGVGDDLYVYLWQRTARYV